MSKIKSLLAVSASATALLFAQGAMAQTTVTQTYDPFGEYLNVMGAVTPGGNAIIEGSSQQNAYEVNVFQNTVSGTAGLNSITQSTGTFGVFPEQTTTNVLETNGVNAEIIGSSQSASNLANFADVTGVNNAEAGSILTITQQVAGQTVDQDATNTASAVGSNTAMSIVGQEGRNTQNAAFVNTGDGVLEDLNILQQFRTFSDQTVVNFNTAVGFNAGVGVPIQSAINIANIASADGSITGDLVVSQTSEDFGATDPSQTAFNFVQADGVNNAHVFGTEGSDGGQVIVNSLNSFSSDALGALGTTQDISQSADGFEQFGTNVAIASAQNNATITGLSQIQVNSVNSITQTSD